MATTKQESQSRPNNSNNPTGKGGFKERPQDISPGGWKSENTISYQYNRFINMTPLQLKEFTKEPDDNKTMAMILALNRVIAANKSLPDLKEITDRTEGKAMQPMEIKAEIFSIDAALE